MRSVDDVDALSESIEHGGFDHFWFSTPNSLVGGVAVSQNPQEFASFLIECKTRAEPIERILEIGSCGGGSAYWMCDVVNPIQMVLVDDNAHARSSDRAKTLAAFSGTVMEIIGNSMDAATQGKVRSLGVQFDLVFIDADHTYEAVRSDYEFAKSVLAPDGWIAFHDTIACDGVTRVWDSLSGDKKEFHQSGKYGIGLFKGEKKAVFKGWGEGFGGAEHIA